MRGPRDVSALVLAAGKRAVAVTVSALSALLTPHPRERPGDGTTACGSHREAQRVGRLSGAGAGRQGRRSGRGPRGCGKDVDGAAVLSRAQRGYACAARAVPASPGCCSSGGTAAARLSRELWAAPGFLPRAGGGRAPRPVWGLPPRWGLAPSRLR